MVEDSSVEALNAGLLDNVVVSLAWEDETDADADSIVEDSWDGVLDAGLPDDVDASIA